MTEFLFQHIVVAVTCQRVDAWIGSPPRGPATAAWARIPVPERREIVWGIATQLGDFAAMRAAPAPQPSLIGYVTQRMASDHPGTRGKFLDSHAEHDPATAARKIYRLAEALTGVVTTVVASPPTKYVPDSAPSNV